MKYIIKAIIKDNESKWEETFIVPYKVTEKEAFNHVSKIVDCFNTCLRPNELPRQLVSIKDICNE